MFIHLIKRTCLLVPKCTTASRWEATVRATSVAAMLIVSASSAGASSLFTDDFESGNLDKWAVGGRQLVGINTANTVVRYGSTVGHLFKTAFTEITLEKRFAYDPLWSLSFDMEVAASSQPPPSSAFYASSGVDLLFRDDALGVLGSVSYLYNTTDFLASLAAGDATRAMVAITPGSMKRYSFDVAELLSKITIDEAMIGHIDVVFRTYSSTSPYPSTSAELWLDNVNVDNDPSDSDPRGVVPLPASIILLGSTVAGANAMAMLRRRRRMNGGGRPGQ